MTSNADAVELSEVEVDTRHAEINYGRMRGYYRASWIILMASMGTYFVDIFMRFNIPTVMPVLRAQYGWDATTVGWVDSAYLWGYALGQIPWGYVSERWLGAKWTVTIGTTMIALASVAFAFHVESIGVGIFARALIGVGSAAIWVPLNPALARWFAPHKRGMQIGVLGAAMPAGTLVGGALMPFLVTGGMEFFGLSGVASGFLLSAIPGLVMMVIVPLVVHDKPEDVGLVSLDGEAPAQTPGTASSSEPSFGYIMTHSPYPYILAVVYAGYLGCLAFVFTWFAAYLNTAYGINVRSAGILWALASTLPAFVSQPLAGMVSDRFGRRRSLNWALMITALTSCVFVLFVALGPTVVPWWGMIVLVLIFGVFVFMWVLVWPFTTLMFPTSAGGPIGGVMNTMAQLTSAIAPVISGYFIDHFGGYTLVFVAGVVSALIGWVASLFLKEHRVV